MKKNLISFLTYNYFAQKVLHYLFIFKTRDYLRKIYNYLFKNYNNEFFFKKEIKNSKKYKEGWSIIFLTFEVKKNLTKKINKYKKIFKKKNYEIIVLTNFNKSKISIKKLSVPRNFGYGGLLDRRDFVTFFRKNAFQTSYIVL